MWRQRAKGLTRFEYGCFNIAVSDYTRSTGWHLDASQRWIPVNRHKRSDKEYRPQSTRLLVKNTHVGAKSHITKTDFAGI